MIIRIYIFVIEVVCESLPKRGKNVAEFFADELKRPCQMRNHTHRITGEKLFEYVDPPCQLEYSCEKGFVKVYDQIECRIDGTYDKKSAFCVAEVNKL